MNVSIKKTKSVVQENHVSTCKTHGFCKKLHEQTLKTETCVQRFCVKNWENLQCSLFVASDFSKTICFTSQNMVFRTNCVCVFFFKKLETFICSGQAGLGQGNPPSDQDLMGWGGMPGLMGWEGCQVSLDGSNWPYVLIPSKASQPVSNLKQLYKGIHEIYKGTLQGDPWNLCVVPWNVWGESIRGSIQPIWGSMKSIRGSMKFIRGIYKGIHEIYKGIHATYKRFYGIYKGNLEGDPWDL